jgi:hypothetical protein
MCVWISSSSSFDLVETSNPRKLRNLTDRQTSSYDMLMKNKREKKEREGEEGREKCIYV